MAISARTYDTQQGNAGRRIILEACPCGYEFAPGEKRDEHIGTHDPEDFGL
jgi:hypothetical protein